MQRARQARTRPSTPTGDPEGERLLDRSVAGALAVMPTGRALAAARRLRSMDAQVALAIGRGIDQIVLLGAGYDGRALRFGGGAVRWFEVDEPARQADKRRRLGALGRDPDMVAYVSADVATEDPCEALAAAGHDTSRPSLFVCDGLVSRLTLEATATLCHAVRARAAAASVLVADYRVAPEADGPGRALRALADLALCAFGQPRRNEFRPGDPEKLMVVTGWRVTQAERTPESRLDRGAHLLVLTCEPGPLPRA
ncbi:MAG: SAM-dependent methyltransferase [Acidimicrobiales bacterium]|nr:SAM-dependent methyltransferase [Acidimicrobiales bacterium]